MFCGLQQFGQLVSSIFCGIVLRSGPRRAAATNLLSLEILRSCQEDAKEGPETRAFWLT